MPILQTGVDIIEIARISKAVSRRGSGFLDRIYTRAELEACGGRVQTLAAHFAAKEAVLKTLGASLFTVPLKDIEVLYESGGRPVVVLHGVALRRAAVQGLTRLAVSLSHSREYALASVVGSD